MSNSTPRAALPPLHEKRTSYERTSERLLALPCLPDRPSCLFRDGRLLVGSQSKHRYSAARLWRTFWRLKHNRRSA